MEKFYINNIKKLYKLTDLELLNISKKYNIPFISKDQVIDIIAFELLKNTGQLKSKFDEISENIKKYSMNETLFLEINKRLRSNKSFLINYLNESIVSNMNSTMGLDDVVMGLDDDEDDDIDDIINYIYNYFKSADSHDINYYTKALTEGFLEKERKTNVVSAHHGLAQVGEGLRDGTSLIYKPITSDFLYRVINKFEYEKWGEYYINYGFTSTFWDINDTKIITRQSKNSIILQIKYPKTLKVIYPYFYNAHHIGEESEIILPPGTIFKKINEFEYEIIGNNLLQEYSPNYTDLSIITWNINNVDIETIKNIIINKADIICLQEVNTINANLDMDNYIHFKCNDKEYNTVIYVRNTIPNTYGLNIDSITFQCTKNSCGDTNKYNEKNQLIINIPNFISISNVHLCGGKYDDIDYKLNINSKETDVQNIINENVDIIVGDFNAETSIEKIALNYDRFKHLNEKEKIIFEKYYKNVHLILNKNNYNHLYNEKDLDQTCDFGTVVDWIYYKNNTKIVPIYYGILKTNGISDHELIYSKFLVDKGRHVPSDYIARQKG